MKLTQTQNHLLLIDEECKIKEGDLCLVTINGEENYHIWIYLSHNTIRDYSYSDLQGNFKKWGIKEKSKIIAYYPLIKEAKELDLPLLPRPVNNCNPFLNGKITKATCYTDSGTFYFEDLERLFKSKQFSLEDMYRVAIAVANKVSRPEYGEIININEIVDTYIQSLSTQQLPKEFIPEYEIVPDQNNYGSGEIFSTNMKEVLKTITNSEGKEVLVGTYKY